MPDFQVATDQLHTASGRLEATGAALHLDYGGVDPSTLGFPAPVLALGLFVAGWSVNGDQLGKVVGLVGRNLNGTAGNYIGAEGANSCPAPRQT